MARASALLGAFLAAGLLFLAVLDWLWLPAERTLVVETSCRAPCSLAVTPDIGRGFLYLDTFRHELASGNATGEIRLPLTSARVRLQLEPGTIRRVTEVTARGREPLPRAVDAANAWSLPLWGDVSTFGYLSSAIVVALALFGLVIPGVRAWIAAQSRAAFGADFPTARSLVVATLLLAAAIFVGASAIDAYHVLVRRVDNPPYWPISLFDPAPFSAEAWLLGGLLLIGGYVAVSRLSAKTEHASWFVVTFGLSALVLTNALQGWDEGFVQPTARQQSYFAESFAVRDVASYLAGYNAQQINLGTHARTHPPGAVLLYYAARLAFRDPATVSIILGGVAFAITIVSVLAIARRFVSERSALLTGLVFALVPAVQTYFIASLEAIACASMTAAIACFLTPRPAVRWLAAAALLVVSLLLTFGSLFVLAVLFLYELFAEHSVRRSLLLFGVVALVLFLLEGTCGFDWYDSLRVASALENPDGFSLLVNRGSYFFTRLEGVSEVLLFASPLVVAALPLLPRGAEFGGLRALCWAGVGSWLAMLLAGAFKTGETARSCLFVYPLLVLPVAALDEARRFSDERRALLAFVPFVQAVLMQLGGRYYW